MRGGRTGKYAWLCVIQPDSKTVRQVRWPIHLAMLQKEAVSELLAGRPATVFGSDVDGVLTIYEGVLALHKNHAEGPAHFSPAMIPEEDPNHAG